jgi:thioredoxin-related protein
MKRYLWAILTGFMVVASARAETVNWQADFDKAVASAKKDGKLVVVDVYTDWCGWCKKLDKDVYADPKVIQKLAKDFVAVKINPEKTARAADLARQFGTRAYPHIVFVNGDGKKIGEIGGYVPADEFLKRLDNITQSKNK